MMQETQVKYYYIRNIENEPVVTICLLHSCGETARGVAICSVLDAPCKKRGRKIALDRALWSFNHKKNACPVVSLNSHPYLYKKRTFYWDGDMYKAAYMPELTPRERKILSNNLLYKRF